LAVNALDMAKPPNILIITADGMRYDAVHCNGNPLARTPSLDRLAGQGTRCDRAYCTQPICMPCRASIMTGRYPWAHGVWQNGVSLPESETLMPRLFSEHQYQTAVFGKCHFKPWLESLEPSEAMDDTLAEYNGDGPYFGFDRARVIDHSGHDRYYDWLAKHHPDWLGLARDQSREKPDGATIAWKTSLPKEATKSRYIADLAIDTLNDFSGKDRPFLMWASFDDPHHPYTPSAPYGDWYDDADFPPPPDNHGPNVSLPPHYHDWARRLREQWGHTDTAQTRWLDVRRMYQGLVSQVDAEIGRVLDALDASGIADDTLVVFCSDHGTMLGDYGLMQVGEYSQEPLVHIPMIWRGPGVQAGTTTDALVNTADLLPTFLAHAGIESPPGIQGRPLTGLLQQGEPVRDALLVGNRWGQDPPAQVRTLVTDRFKLTVGHAAGMGELYDLHDDPWELHNRFGDPSLTGVQAQLTQRLAMELLNTQDPLPQRTACW